MNAMTPLRGQKIVVRCSNGKLKQNIVWDWRERVVYVCSERQYAALQEGLDAPPPIGFLTKDVTDMPAQ